MARLLRSTTEFSRIRKPTVVGAPTVFRPVAVKLVATRAMSEYRRHDRRNQLSYRVKPPTVTGSPVVFRPLFVETTNQRPQRSLQRRPRSVLGQPQVIGDQVVTFVPVPLLVKLAGQQPQQRDTLRKPHARLRAALFTVPPFAPLVVASGTALRTAQELRRTRPHSKLGAALFVDPPAPAVTVACDALRTAATLRRTSPHSKLRAPTVTGTPTVFDPVKVRACAWQETGLRRNKRQPRPKLNPPTVTGASTVFRSVQLHQTRARPKPTHPRLRGVPNGVKVLAPATVTSKATVTCTLTIERVLTAAVSSKATVSCILTTGASTAHQQYDFPPLFLFTSPTGRHPWDSQTSATNTSQAVRPRSEDQGPRLN